MHRLSRRQLFWSAFVLCFAVRLLIGLSRIDETELERYGGSFAWALLHGMPLDPHKLPIIAHLRGSVLFGVLLLPSVALLGPKLIAVKLLALVWSGLLAGLTAVLVERTLGRFAALCAALLVICAPPSVQMVSVLALGSHEGVALWVLLALYCLLGAGPGAPLRAPRAGIFGLLCGLACAYSWQSAMALPGLALAWLCLDRRFALRARSWLFVPGFALGAAPIPFLSPAGATEVVGRSLGSLFLPQGALHALKKLGSTLSSDLRRSWLFEEHGGAFLGWALLACLLVGLCFGLKRALRGDALAAYALAHPLVLLLAYACMDFKIDFFNTGDGMGSRYFLPVWPCFALWIAIGARELRQSAWIPLGWLLGLVPVALGVAATLALAGPAAWWKQPSLRGTDFPGFGVHLSYAGGGTWLGKKTWIDRLDPDWTPFRPLSYPSDKLPEGERCSTEWLARRLPEAAAMDEWLRPYVLCDLGYHAAEARRADVLELARLELAGSDLAWFERGAGTSVFVQVGIHSVTRRLQPDTLLQALARLPAGMRERAAEGAGFAAALRVNPYNRVPLEALEQGARLPPALQRIYFRAAGLGYRLRYFQASYWVPQKGALRIEGLLPESGRAAFREGLALPMNRFDTAAELDPALWPGE